MVNGSKELNKRHLRPTIKQRRLARILGEDSSLPMGKAMIKAGYSPSTAIKPSQLTQSDRWQQLLEKDLPDSLLSRTAKQGIRATGTRVDVNGKIVKYKDHATRHKFLETALKMKGKLVDRTDITTGGQQVTGFTFIAPTTAVMPTEGEIVDDDKPANE